MQLSINSLKEMGAFTGAPVEKEISWKKGDAEFTATVFVRQLSYITTVNEFASARIKSEPVANRIAACICDENGNAVFTAADITGEADPERGPLDGNLTVALLAVIGEVNGLGGKTKS